MAQEFMPSPQQHAIFNWVEMGTGSAIVEAVAGSGKTNTAIRAMDLMRGSVYYGVFNKKLVPEAKAKAQELGIDLNRKFIGTMHSAGYSAWRRFLGAGVSKLKDPDDNKTRDICENNGVPEEWHGYICKMVSFGKQMLVKPHMPDDYGSDNSRWSEINDHFGADSELPGDADMNEIYTTLDRVYTYSFRICRTTIDFDDMIFAPLMYNAQFYQNDWLILDEAQDTNPARRLMARRMLKRNGRLVALGDRHQAIYGFCHPAGTNVLTPSGYRLIEELKVGDEYISVNTSGDVAGWNGSYKIVNTTQHVGWDWLIEVSAAGRSVKVTPHHRLPVRMPEGNYWFTYVMKRGDKYRVGYMASHAGKDRRFMLSQRCIMEGADAAWVIRVHATKYDAIIDEARMHAEGAYGGSWVYLTQDQINALDQDPDHYINLIDNAGRHPAFPLWKRGVRMHFEKNVPVIVEACNIITGMMVNVLGDWDDRKRGRSRHTGGWEVALTTTLNFDTSTPTYGIEVVPMPARDSYSKWPLYVADGIIVHNTGADSNSLQLIEDEFKCVRLPLTVSYRCPQLVVAEAQRYVSHIEASDMASEGFVGSIPASSKVNGQFVPWFVTNTPTKLDAVLCRYTKPLVSTAYAMISAGYACRVEGRDIGKNLIALVTRWKTNSLERLGAKLDQYYAREARKADLKRRESIRQLAEDKVETTKIFIRRCQSLGQHKVQDVVDAINALFADNVAGCTVLSTIHKSKGREWPTVYYLVMPDPMREMKYWEEEAERNCKYVAITRAQESLIYVEGT